MCVCVCVCVCVCDTDLNVYVCGLFKANDNVCLCVSYL